MLTETFNDPKKPHKIVIAVDGPAASGKGTVAKALAKQLGYAYLDTGSLYRNVALETLKQGGDPTNLEDVRKALPILSKVLTAEQVKNPELRTEETAEAAANVASMPEVRKAVRDYQRRFTQNPPDDAPGIVLDGRDVGTVVYPDADVKFFVTADVEERARRRYEELKNRIPGLTKEDVLQEISARDQHDTSRMDSPLKPADDAYVLDNTRLTPDETLKVAFDVVAKKLNPPANIKPPAPKL